MSGVTKCFCYGMDAFAAVLLDVRHVTDLKSRSPRTVSANPPPLPPPDIWNTTVIENEAD